METHNETRCSLCIFCLKAKDNVTDDFYNDDTRKGELYRYFKVIIRHFFKHGALISVENQEWCTTAFKVISETTINSDTEEPFFRNVHICTNCEIITRKFSYFYHQIKELELKMDWEISQLWDVMGCADLTLSKLTKDELENTSTFAGGGVTLGEFRNTFKRSCKAYQEIKKKMTVPNIHLPQINVEDFLLERLMDNVDSQINAESSPTISGSTMSMEVEDYAIQLDTQEYPTQSQAHHEYFTQNEVESHPPTLIKEVEEVEPDKDHQMIMRFSDCPMVADSESLPAPLSPLVLQEEDPLNPPNGSQSAYICTTLACSLTFTSKFELFQHNMAHHVGKYFSSVQQIDTPNDQFNHSVAHLLEKTLDTFIKVDENYKCPYCSNHFPGMEKARNHLVVKHRPILKGKLVVQKSECGLPHTPQWIESSLRFTNDSTNTTVKRKRGRQGGQISKNRFHCTPCSQSFQINLLMFQHNMNNHPEKYFTSVKLEFLTPNQFQNCVAHMLATTVEEFEKVGSKYQCKFCSILISSKQYIKHHLVRKHRPVLKNKLIELQNSSNINLIMNTSRRTIKSRSLTERRNTKQDHICKFCGKVYSKSFTLNQHQRYSHPETFFDMSNLLPASSENNDQFKTCVEYVLEQHIQNPFPQEGDQVKCGICFKVSNKRLYAKIHLVSRHRVFLAEKLQDVQKSGKSFNEIRTELLRMNGGQILKNTSVETGSNFRPNVTTANTLSFDCSICSVSFRTKHNLFQHDVGHHIEKYFPSVKLETVTKELFKNCIDQTLRNCLGNFQRIGSKYKCSFCSNYLSGIQAARQHLVVKHRMIITDKLVEIQNSGTFPLQAESSITSLKRKGGWPKGKSRLLSNSSLVNLKFGNLQLKTKRGVCRPRGRVVDHVPVLRRRRVPKVTRCEKCGKSFANVYTLRTHLKGYCKVARNTDEAPAKIEEERLGDSGIADLSEN